MKTKMTLLAMGLALAAPMAMAQDNTERQTDPAYKPATTQTTTKQRTTTTDATRAPSQTTMERPDAWVLTKVKSQFAGSSIVDASDINVDVQSGIVTLTGTVSSAAEKQEALRLAQTTEGVKSVNSTGLRMDAVASDAKSKEHKDAHKSGHKMDKDYNKNN